MVTRTLSVAASATSPRHVKSRVRVHAGTVAVCVCCADEVGGGTGADGALVVWCVRHEQEPHARLCGHKVRRRTKCILERARLCQQHGCKGPSILCTSGHLPAQWPQTPVALSHIRCWSSRCHSLRLFPTLNPLLVAAAASGVMIEDVTDATTTPDQHDLPDAGTMESSQHRTNSL